MTSVYIYEELAKVSGNYHEGGGAVIVSEDPQKAWFKYWTDIVAEHPSNAEYEELAKEKLPEPTATYPTEATEEKVFIFPDAGCC